MKKSAVKNNEKKYNAIIENLMLNLKEQEKDLAITTEEYKQFIKSVELEKTKYFSADGYTKFVGKVVNYEKLRCFIKNTFTYIFNGGNSFWITKNICKKELKYEFLKDLTTFNKCYIKYKNPNFNIDDEKSKPWIKKSFSNILEELRHELQYKCVDFIPKHENIEPGTFNLFTSFRAQKCGNVIDESKIDKILWHIRHIWCKNNDDLYNYIINWLAHLMQYPYKKIGIAILLKSEQGAGKNIIWEFIADCIIGKKYSLVIGDIDRLLGRFNSIVQNRLLTICDEISNYGGAFKSNNKLKNLITQTEQHIEKKGIDTIPFTDFNNYIFLSNNNWPIKVEQSDRRFFCLELSNSKCKDSEYFNSLAHQLNNNCANIFYNYLLKIDISNWDKLKIPDTGLRNELKINSLPKTVQFLIRCVEGEIDSIHLDKIKNKKKLQTSELYALFLDNYGYKTNITKIELARQLSKFGLKHTKIKICGHQTRGYELDYNIIISKLKNMKICINIKN